MLVPHVLQQIHERHPGPSSEAIVLPTDKRATGKATPPVVHHQTSGIRHQTDAGAEAGAEAAAAVSVRWKIGNLKVKSLAPIPLTPLINSTPLTCIDR